LLHNHPIGATTAATVLPCSIPQNTGKTVVLSCLPYLLWRQSIQAKVQILSMLKRDLNKYFYRADKNWKYLKVNDLCAKFKSLFYLSCQHVKHGVLANTAKRS
jgi:hypothetical protein